jgi:hypothetical protein
MQECPVCKKQTERERLDLQFGGSMLGLTTCKECRVVIGAETGHTGDPLPPQLRNIEDRLAKLEKKIAAT